MTNHVSLFQQIGAHKFRNTITIRREVGFIPFYLICTIDSVHICLILGNWPIIKHDIIKIDLRRILLYCKHMSLSIEAIRFARLRHEIGNEDLCRRELPTKSEPLQQNHQLRPRAQLKTDFQNCVRQDRPSHESGNETTVKAVWNLRKVRSCSCEYRRVA